MDDDEVDAYLKGYRDLPGSQDEKFKKYAEQIRTGTKPGATSLRNTFSLVKQSKEKRAQQLAKALYKRRVVIVYGPAGTNHGILRDRGTWDPKKQMYADGVIVVANRYEGNWLGTAAVLAHELRHLLDVEETKMGRLHIGIDERPESLNEDEPQRRANINSGAVAAGLDWKGYHDIYAKITPAQWEEVAKKFGPNWRNTEDMLAQIDFQVEELRKFEKDKPKLKAHRCGRPCKEAKYGTCDRMVYFPPCWDH